MKIETYVCDKCRKPIKGNIFSLTPECLDPNNTENVIGIPDEISDELYEMVCDKHLCLKCVKRALRISFTSVATVNEDFEAELKTLLQPRELVKVKPNNTRKCSRMPYVDIKKLLDQGKTIDEVAKIAGSNKYALQKKIKYHESKANNSIEKPVKTTKPEEPAKGLANERLSKDKVMLVYCDQDKDMSQCAQELGCTVDELRRFLINNRIFKNSRDREKYDCATAPQPVI